MDCCLNDRDITGFVQCALVNGTRHQISWIPARYAVAGKILKLCGEEGWLVKSTGARACRAPHVPGLIRQHERNTGDSERKR